MKRLPPVSDRSAAHALKFVERPAAREVIGPHPAHSFRWIDHDYPSPVARWNYHPEYEAHLIREGTGSYIIGDQVGPFAAGHVALIGPELPHDWMSDLEPDEVIHNRDAVIQFDDEWFERCAASMPELGQARAVLRESNRGIVFLGETAVSAAEAIENVGRSDGVMRLSHMFALFSILASAPQHEKQIIANEWFANTIDREGNAAVDAGLRYIFDNLSDRIRMSEAARLALMSEPTFSKYFKKASGLTFTEMVRKLRIANACRQLEQTDASIAAISSSVGYENLANFNRQFRAQTGTTPSAFRRSDGDRRKDSAEFGLRRDVTAVR